MAKQLDNKYIYFLETFLDHLNKIEIDPISIEIQIMKIFRDKQVIRFDQIINYIERISVESKMFNFNHKDTFIAITPSIVNSLKEFLSKRIIELNNQTVKLDTETNNLIKLLMEKYENAPKGYQMTMVHLFGIENSEKLIGKDLKLISNQATGLESLYVEINKGIKLSRFVKLIKND